MADAHANGPRTLVTAILREGGPVRADVAERALALEAGRHPTLTELRRALGLDLDLAPARQAALEAWPGRSPDPPDGDLVRVVEAMYRAIASTRMISVRIGADGLHPTRSTGDPIRLRDEEHLVLYVLADNETGAGVRFSAEAHGEGIGGYIEAQRTGSALFDAGAMHPGAYLLPLMIVAEGRPATIDVPVECARSGTLRVRILDDGTGGPVAARVYLADDLGPAWPPGATFRRDVHGNGFFHADGSFEARVSGAARLRVVRGIEHEAVEMEIAVPADAEIDAVARLKRWSHMAAGGWYSGDVHVHMHYGGEYLLGPEDVALAQRAEDVNFLNMMVANQGSGWVHDIERFSGKPHELSGGAHIFQWGEEYRNDFLGHMCMYGIRELVQPIYSGFPNSDHPHDVPANAEAASDCHAAGGTLSYAHPLFGGGDLDRVFAVRRTVEAKELPVDAALGQIDALDVMSYPSNTAETCRLWHRLLNCGLRLAATAGTDTFMNMCADGTFSNPPAGDRAYARIDGAFTTESWCAAVRAGRTFVTNGPMISLDVAGHGIGDEISAAEGDVLRIECGAAARAPIDRLELIVNGEVVATAADGEHRASLTHDLKIGRSCWVAARVSGPVHELVLDRDGAFAHTSPVYVSVDGAPVATVEDATYFVEWIDRLIAVAAEKGVYPSSGERDRVAAIFREGQAYYRRIAGRYSPA